MLRRVMNNPFVGCSLVEIQALTELAEHRSRSRMGGIQLKESGSEAERIRGRINFKVEALQKSSLLWVGRRLRSGVHFSPRLAGTKPVLCSIQFILRT